MTNYQRNSLDITEEIGLFAKPSDSAAQKSFDCAAWINVHFQQVMLCGCSHAQCNDAVWSAVMVLFALRAILCENEGYYCKQWFEKGIVHIIIVLRGLIWHSEKWQKALCVDLCHRQKGEKNDLLVLNHICKLARFEYDHQWHLRATMEL